MSDSNIIDPILSGNDSDSSDDTPPMSQYPLKRKHDEIEEKDECPSDSKKQRVVSENESCDPHNDVDPNVPLISELTSLADKEKDADLQSMSACVQLWRKRSKNVVSLHDAAIAFTMRTKAKFKKVFTTTYLQGPLVMFPKCRFVVESEPDFAAVLAANQTREDKHTLTADFEVEPTAAMKLFFHRLSRMYVNRVCGGAPLTAGEALKKTNEQGEAQRVWAEGDWHNPMTTDNDLVVAAIQGTTVEDRIQYFLTYLISDCAAGQFLKKSFESPDFPSIPMRMQPFNKNFQSSKSCHRGVGGIWGIMQDNEVGLDKGSFIMDKKIASSFGSARKGPVVDRGTTWVSPSVRVKITYFDGVMRMRVMCQGMILKTAPALVFEEDDDLLGQM